MSKYLLIDFYPLFHRSRRALSQRGSFTSPSGFPTTGIFSSLRTVFSIEKKWPDHKIVIVTEGKDSTNLRKKLSPGYKGGRKNDSNFYVELNKTLEILGNIFPVISREYREADDTIAAIVDKADSEDEFIVWSCDRDLLPLISENVQVNLFSTNKKQKLWGIPEFKEEYDGLEPEALYLVKAFMGDPSDNIPGFKGVGKKTAIKFYREGGVSSPKFLEKYGDDGAVKLLHNWELIRPQNIQGDIPLYENFTEDLDTYQAIISSLDIRVKRNKT